MVLGLRANNARDLVIEVAEMLGILVGKGIASAGAATSITDSVNFPHATANELAGTYVHIHTGTGIGQERVITASGAGTGALTVGTWGTNPSTDSEFIVTRLVPPSRIYRALDSAISRYARQCSVPWENHYLAVNNIFNDPDNIGQVDAEGLVYNWQFDRWATVNVPDHWTLTNSNSDEENTAQAWGGLRRVLKLQNTGSSAGSAVLAVENFLKWGGHKVRLHAMMLANDASRLTGRIDDGVDTLDTEAHEGDGHWKRPSSSWHTVSDDLTKLEGSYQISSGAQITTYAGPLYLEADYAFQEYLLPQAFTVIEDIYFELINFADFGRYDLRPIPHHLWEIAEGPATNAQTRHDSGEAQDTFNQPRLILRTDRSTPPTPARIKIVGRGFPNLIGRAASDNATGVPTVNYEATSPVVAPELIKYAAALSLNESLPRSARSVDSGYLNLETRTWERRYTSRMPTNARRARSW